MRELIEQLEEINRRFYADDIETEEYAAQVGRLTAMLRQYIPYGE